MSTKGLQILDSLIPPYDETLSETSTNAVQNKAVASAVSDLNSRIDETNGSIMSITVDSIGAAKSDHNHDDDYDTLGAADTALDSAKSYTDTKTSGLASTSTVDSKFSAHNTSTSAHSDIRVLISDLTTKLNNFLDVDDTTTDQLSEVLTLINNNKGTLESLTTSKINVSAIVDNLTTNSTSKVLSAAQGVAIKSLIDALQTEFDTLETVVAGKANATHSHAISDVTNLQSSLDAKANSSDIAKTVYTAASNSSPIYVKISDFGAWGTGAWYQKGFSMLLTSRAGELIWVSLAADDSNTNARALRLINVYTKINALYYSASESALYCKMRAWCNNLSAHILTNINGDYVPTVAQASALPDDAIEIEIVEFGITPTDEETRMGYFWADPYRAYVDGEMLAFYDDDFITTANIDTICGQTMTVASLSSYSEVTF